MTTTAPPTLTPAGFKTARESLGLSVAFVAGVLGVHEQSVWRYEVASRDLPVPEHAAEGMRALLDAFESVAQHIAAEAQRTGKLTRYADLQVFEAKFPTMAGWGSLAQGLVIARAQALAGGVIEYA